MLNSCMGEFSAACACRKMRFTNADGTLINSVPFLFLRW